MLHLSQIARAISGSPDRTIDGERAAGVSTDTRTLKAGEVFFALRGPNFDGHDFIGEAFRRGALASVVERIVPAAGPLIRVGDTTEALGILASVYRMTLGARVIAVTGSNGKTTTQSMIAHILGKDRAVVKPPGSFNNFIGLPLTLFSATPGTEFLVLELGTNHRGEISRLAEIARPDAAVITSVGPAHLEGLGNVEEIAEEKTSLLDRVRAGGHAIVHDDPRILSRVRLPLEKVVTFGFSSGADLFPTDLEREPLRFRARGVPFHLNLLGDWNALNALAASAAAMLYGVPLTECARRLEDFKPPKMRMERLELNGIGIVNDAYNSNPVSALHAVEEFGRMRAARKIVVIGAMKELGDGSESWHRELGRKIGEIRPDRVVAVGPECRALVEEVPGAVFFERVEALEGRIGELVRAGDLVLLKGSRAVGLEKVVKYIGAMVEEHQALSIKHQGLSADALDA